MVSTQDLAQLVIQALLHAGFCPYDLAAPADRGFGVSPHRDGDSVIITTSPTNRDVLDELYKYQVVLRPLAAEYNLRAILNEIAGGTGAEIIESLIVEPIPDQALNLSDWG